MNLMDLFSNPLVWVATIAGGLYLMAKHGKKDKKNEGRRDQGGRQQRNQGDKNLNKGRHQKQTA